MPSVGGKGASLNKKLKELAAKIEEMEGRKEIKVKEYKSVKSFCYVKYESAFLM